MTRFLQAAGRQALSAIFFTALAACGDGDHPAGAAPGFELRDASPATHAGTLSVRDAADTSTELRAADGFSAVPYCLVRFTNLRHTGGGSYTLNLAFARTDRRVLAVTLTQHGAAWFVTAFDPPDSAAQVDTGRRMLTLRALRGTQGQWSEWQATVSGTAAFPAAAGSEACG